ncbi:MAG: 4Fe-4S dicluster domain-containing protein [Candidatus Bathyarchaeia archaeon]
MVEEAVEASKFDVDFKFSLAGTREGKTILRCFQCGICTSGCPHSDILDIKPHQMAKMALLGMKEELISCEAIWVCSSCFMCSERCPQGVDLGSVVFALRNIAVDEGRIPEGIKSVGIGVFNTGRLVRVTSLRERERAALGLPETPPVDVETIQRLLRETRIDDLIVE